VLSDILATVDRGDFATLAQLYLSTAFNTVDHTILLECLQRSYEFSDAALSWVASYLAGCPECIRRDSCCSTTLDLVCMW
jgi:hypothetical protein